MKNIKKILRGKTLFAIIVPLALTFFVGGPLRSQNVNVKIITVADLHATVLPWDFVNDLPLEGSLAHVRTYVEQQRKNADQHVILLDNGDLLQGQPSGYFFNFVVPHQPHLITRAMNLMRFDAATVGNHDIETGPDVYNKLREEFKFPWLSANIIDTKTNLPWFEPYTIIEKDGVRIAVIGLVTPSVPNWLPRKLWEGMYFQNTYAAAKHWVEVVKKSESPDAIIGLFHSGIGPDIPYKGDSVNLENGSLYIAQNVPGFDIIFTGHDHQKRNISITNVAGEKVYIVAGEPFGRSVAVADLQFTKGENGNMELKTVITSIENTSLLEPCPAMVNMFSGELAQVRDYINQPLGYLQTDLSSRNSLFGNSAFVDLVHKIQKDITGADISFAAPLAFDATIREGMFTMKDAFRLYQYENYLYIMELTGEEIVGFLEHSYGLWFNTMKTPDDNLLLLRKDEKGELILNNSGRARLQHPFFNFDSASGIVYTVDVSKKPGNRLTIISMADGARFDKNKIYRVAITSYRGSGGGDHLTEGAAIPHAELESRIVFVSDKGLRSYIAGYFKEQQKLNPVSGSNWKILPANWVEKAMERDKYLLFGSRK